MNKQRLVLAAAAIASCTAATLIMLTLKVAYATGFANNADTLYVPMMAQDLLHRGFSAWNAWWRSPAPYIWPDITLAVIAAGLARSPQAIWLLDLFLVTALLWTAAWLFLKAASQNTRAFAWFVVLWFAVVWCAWIWPFPGTVDTLYIFLTIVVPAVHGGAVICTVLGFAMMLPALRGRLKAGVGLFPLVAATTASDILFVPLFAIPVLTLSALHYFETRARNTKRLAVLVGTAALVGYCCERLLNPQRAVYMHESNMGAWSAFRALINFVQEGCTHGDWGRLLFCGAVLALSAWAARDVLMRRWTDQAIMRLLLALACAGALSASVATGLFQGQDHVRYILICPVAVLLWLAFEIEQLRVHRLAAPAAGAALVGGVFLLFALRGAPEIAVFNRGYPLVHCIDAQVTPIGIANYWDAKPITFFTQGNVTVEGINDDGDPFPWVTRKTWATDVVRRSLTQSFFIIPRPQSRSRLLERYGEPMRADQCEGQEIWFYSSRSSAHPG